MKPKILRTDHGQYEFREWSGFNNSGIQPIGDKVLLLVDPALAKTTGGIVLTQDSEERQSLASTTGILVAIGELAFQWHPQLGIKWGQMTPQIGDRVYFAKYAGQLYSGLDGETYRLVSDSEIGGVQMEPEMPATQAAA